MYLGNENNADHQAGSRYNERGGEPVCGVQVILYDVTNSHTHNAEEKDVVDTGVNQFGVV